MTRNTYYKRIKAKYGQLGIGIGCFVPAGDLICKIVVTRRQNNIILNHSFIPIKYVRNIKKEKINKTY